MSKQIITVIDAPEVSLSENETAAEALLKFYRALGWNGEDVLDPCKVRTTKLVFDYLYKVMDAKYPESDGVAMTMIHIGPSVDDHIPPGKVYLLEGWIKPAELKEGV
jgi:AAA+ superfamily predicted ATPase